MHLRGAGIGEADVDAAGDQGPHQTFRTVHRSTPASFPETDRRSIIPGAFRQRVSLHCCSSPRSGVISVTALLSKSQPQARTAPSRLAGEGWGRGVATSALPVLTPTPNP